MAASQGLSVQAGTLSSYGRTSQARISPELIRRRTEVQGSGVWSPPTGTLGRIVQETESRVESLRRVAAGLADAARAAKPPTRSLAKALRQDRVAVIAEVKRKSPSKG